MNALSLIAASWLLVAPSIVAAAGSFSLGSATPACGPFSVPLTAVDGAGGLAFDFNVAFDPAIVTPIDIETTALTQDCGLLWNVVPPESQGAPATLRIAVPCFDGLNGSSGPFLTIHFVAEGHGSSPLTFTRCQVDEVNCVAAQAGSVNLTACPTPTPAPTPTPTPGPPCTCVGDADKNGLVNVFDYAAIRNNFGSSQGTNPAGIGDADCNGLVNVFDYAAVRAQFGKQCAAQ